MLHLSSLSEFLGTTSNLSLPFQEIGQTEREGRIADISYSVRLSAAKVVFSREEGYGRYQAWAAVSLQSQIWSRVPSAVLPPVTSRQRPDCGFTRRFWFRQRHCWAPVPLQSQSWICVPLAVPPPVTSMHLPRARSVPSPLFHAQLCALVPLHVQIWIAVPLFVPAPASSMHFPPLPRIGPAPRYFALTTDGVSRL